MIFIETKTFIKAPLYNFQFPYAELWRQLGIDCNKWVVQMVKPLKAERAQRTRVLNCTR